MRKIMLILIPSLFGCLETFSQNWEGGIFAGASNYRGDLAPYIIPSETHPAFGFFVKRNLNQFFSFRVGMTQGKVSGDDANNEYLKYRNLSFHSSITELSTTFEFNFFPFLKGLKPDQFTPFVYSGIALFRFNPKTTYNNTTYELAELNTEGQGITDDSPKDYGLYQPAIPIGGGFKLRIANRLNLTFKVGYRATFTDFLDDVSTNYPSKEALANKGSKISAELSDRSQGLDGEFYTGKGKQRGDSQTNDWYVFTGLTISYHIKNPICYDF